MASLPAATLAVTSFLQYHPSAKALVAVADARFHHIDIPDITVLHTSDLASLLGEEVMLRLATAYADTDLTRSLRPRLLRTLVARTDGPTVFVSLPDDAEVEAFLRPLVAGAVRAGAAIIPARLSDIPPDGRLPDASDIVRSGRFDQELFAVTNKGLPLLNAWSQALETSAHIPLARLDPIQHPWLDSLAITHGALLLREPGLAVSYRNAEEPGRSFEPLVVRFPGFNPKKPWIVSELAGEQPRIKASEHLWLASRLRRRSSELLRLIDSYGFDVRDHKVIGGYDLLDDGSPFDPIMRRAYRVGLSQSANHAAPDPPNPFIESSEVFFRWLNEPFPNPTNATRYLRALHDLSPLLQKRFVDPDDQGPNGYTAWVRALGRDQAIPGRLIPLSELPDLVRVNATLDGIGPGGQDILCAQSNSLESVGSTELADHENIGSAMQHGQFVHRPESPEAPGVHVVGLLRAELGIGTAGRLLLRNVERSGLPFSVEVDDATAHRQEHPLGLEHDLQVNQVKAAHPVTVVALNADALIEYVARHPGKLDHTTVVGLWFWETEVFPPRFHSALEIIDEIWVATAHIQRAISAATDKPVHLVPLGAPTPQTDIELLRRRAEREFAIDEHRFVVMFCFDYASVAERKNPWGVVEAFTRAFPKQHIEGSDGRVPLLVLKTINAERYPLDAERLRFAIGARNDIVVLDDYVSSYLTIALLSRADCYLSLHRAEGWGLTIAEAMAVAAPVVVTGYSGSNDLVDDQCGWRVPYSLVDIPSDVAQYANAGRWAEPDVDAAAEIVRTLFRDHEAGRAKGLAGQERIAILAKSFSGAETIAQRVNAITEQRHTARLAKIASTAEQPQEEPNIVDEGPMQLKHPGLGPVVLPSTEHESPAPSGVRGTVRSQIERAIKFEIDRRDVRDHERAAALVSEISLTRQAVRDVVTAQRADQETLTQAITDTGNYVRSLQASHDSLHESVVQIGRFTHDHANTLVDVREEVRELRAHIEHLTRTIQQLVANQNPEASTPPDTGSVGVNSVVKTTNNETSLPESSEAL